MRGYWDNGVLKGAIKYSHKQHEDFINGSSQGYNALFNSLLTILTNPQIINLNKFKQKDIDVQKINIKK